MAQFVGRYDSGICGPAPLQISTHRWVQVIAIVGAGQQVSHDRRTQRVIGVNCRIAIRSDFLTEQNVTQQTRLRTATKRKHGIQGLQGSRPSARQVIHHLANECLERLLHLLPLQPDEPRSRAHPAMLAHHGYGHEEKSRMAEGECGQIEQRDCDLRVQPVEPGLLFARRHLGAIHQGLRRDSKLREIEPLSLRLLQCQPQRTGIIQPGQPEMIRSGKCGQRILVARPQGHEHARARALLYARQRPAELARAGVGQGLKIIQYE